MEFLLATRLRRSRAETMTYVSAEEYALWGVLFEVEAEESRS